MTSLIEAAQEASEALTKKGLAHALIGGLAVTIWGDPRLTQDADFTVLAPFGQEEGAVDSLLSLFRPRMPGAKEFALQNRVLLLWIDPTVPLDIGLGSFPLEEEMIRRAKPVEIIKGRSLPVVSPEDLIVMKSFAGRPQDWRDVEGVAARQRNRLDWDIILRGAALLAEASEDPDMLPRLAALRERWS